MILTFRASAKAALVQYVLLESASDGSRMQRISLHVMGFRLLG